MASGISKLVHHFNLLYVVETASGMTSQPKALLAAERVDSDEVIHPTMEVKAPRRIYGRPFNTKKKDQVFKRWKHKYLRGKTFIQSCWHGKKKCDSEVRVEIVRPSPLDAVNKFEEVGNF